MFLVILRGSVRGSDGGPELGVFLEFLIHDEGEAGQLLFTEGVFDTFIWDVCYQAKGPA